MQPSGNAESSDEDSEAAREAALAEGRQQIKDHFQLGANDIFEDEDGLLRNAAFGNSLSDNLEQNIIKWRTYQINWFTVHWDKADEERILFLEDRGRYTDEDGEAIEDVNGHIETEHTTHIIQDTTMMTELRGWRE